MIQIRPYNDSDKSAVLNLLSLNSPVFFAPSEKIDLEQYLEHEVEDYFVVEENGNILGCGGINYFPKEKNARISWDIVDPNFQGKGIGKQLVEHRLHILQKNQEINGIIVRTSQHTYLFYKKMGFELRHVEKDFWTEGFDLYEMVLRKIK